MHVYIARGTNKLEPTVSSHNFNMQSFRLRFSDAKTVPNFHFKVPFGCSNLPGAGSIFPD